MKLRGGGRVVSMAVAAAFASSPVNTDGGREILCVAVRPSESGTFRAEVPRSRARRGLRGLQPAISAAHAGLRA